MNQEENKTADRWKVVGYNVLALVAYTLLFRLSSDGVIFDCMVVIMHFIVCLILLLVKRKWEWLLSAFLVVAIGFSTCVTFLNMPSFH